MTQEEIWKKNMNLATKLGAVRFLGLQCLDVTNLLKRRYTLDGLREYLKNLDVRDITAERLASGRPLFVSDTTYYCLNKLEDSDEYQLCFEEYPKDFSDFKMA
jgi:hypothetical protein